jgi:luciferase family oxidoreductase group 1
MEPMKIGILEIGIRKDTNGITAIEEILGYAREADQLGFSRFWLGEHHPPDSTNPYTNPDILLGIIAGMTERIKVGSAGTLITLYSPYSVVTNYKLLNNLFPSRIDLGLSKGLPGNKHVLELVSPPVTFENADERFASNLQEICDLFHQEEEKFKKHELVIPPFSGEIPSMWYLSGSYNHFPMAIKNKLNYCRSIFHGTIGRKIEPKKEELQAYKEQFFKVNGYYPEVSLALAFYMADTQEEAQKEVDKMLDYENINLLEAWKVIPVTIDSLETLLQTYQEEYGIDEFILYDAALVSDIKMKNIGAISERFKLAEVPTQVQYA